MTSETAKTWPVGEGTEWFWAIVDRFGLGNVPSDEVAALRLFCDKAERYDALASPARDKAAGGDGKGDASAPVTILYTNWRGETAVRKISPWDRASRFWFGSTDWHPEPQWLLNALDMEKGQQRDFAMSGFKAWGAEAVAAAREPAPSIEALKAAVELEIQAAIGSVTTRGIGALIDRVANERVRQALAARFASHTPEA